MRTLLLILLYASVTAAAATAYPVSFQIRISSDVAGKYAGGDSQDLVVDARDVRALFVGDSITFNNPRAERNAGVGGATTAAIGVRFAKEISQGSPRYVHIHAGANDFTDSKPPNTAKMLSDVGAMIDAAKARHIPVIVGTVLPMDLNWSPMGALIPAYNEQLKSLVLQKRGIVADYYSAMVLPDGSQNKALFKDPVHPNEAGYAVMNQVLDKAIARLQRREERRAKWKEATPEQRAAWREKREAKKK